VIGVLHSPHTLYAYTCTTHLGDRKLYLEQIIRPHELAGVQDGLADHQKQLYHNPNTQNTDSCLTLLQRANIEHNVVATSHIYANMGMQQLGGLLGVDADV
ncbi:hypothetical protein SARC_16236, partial [Sphaeroforma arctica JP610]